MVPLEALPRARVPALLQAEGREENVDARSLPTSRPTQFIHPDPTGTCCHRGAPREELHCTALHCFCPPRGTSFLVGARTSAPPDLRDPSPAKVGSLPGGSLSLVTRASAVGHAPVQGHAYPRTCSPPVCPPGSSGGLLPRCPAWSGKNWEKSRARISWRRISLPRRMEIGVGKGVQSIDRARREGARGGVRPARAQNTEGAESGLELVNSEEGKCRAARGRSAEEEGTEVQRELWGEGSRARRGREGGGSGVGEGPPRVGHGAEGEGDGGGEAGERDSNFKEGRGGGTFTTKLGRTRARWGRAGTGERAPAPPGRGARMRSRRSAWLRHGGRGRPTTARSSPSPSPPFSLSSSTRS